VSSALLLPAISWRPLLKCYRMKKSTAIREEGSGAAREAKALVALAFRNGQQRMSMPGRPAPPVKATRSILHITQAEIRCKGGVHHSPHDLPRRHQSKKNFKPFVRCAVKSDFVGAFGSEASGPAGNNLCVWLFRYLSNVLSLHQQDHGSSRPTLGARDHSCYTSWFILLF
jgi:hypothetical protein